MPKAFFVITYYKILATNNKKIVSTHVPELTSSGYMNNENGRKVMITIK